VPVEGHGCVAEAFGDTGHGDRGEAVGVGDLDGGADDLLDGAGRS
jgi:hypothetical protein